MGVSSQRIISTLFELVEIRWNILRRRSHLRRSDIFASIAGGKENVHYFRQCLLRLSVMMNRTGFQGAHPLVGKWDYSVFLRFFCSSLGDELYSQKGWGRGGNQKRMWEGRGRQRETSLLDSLNFWCADPCSWSFNYTEMRSVFFAEPPPLRPPRAGKVAAVCKAGAG